MNKLPEIVVRHNLVEKIQHSMWGEYFGPDLVPFLKWVDLPPFILKDIAKCKWDDSQFQLPNNDEIEDIIIEMLESAGSTTKKLPYHNIEHFQRAYVEASNAIKLVEELTDFSFPEAVKQAFFVGVAGHDHNHTGATYLTEKEKKASYKSVEGRSALIVDRFLEKKGYHPLYRAFVAYTIASSTYGGEKIGIYFMPIGFFGLLMRAVDVLPSKDFVTSVHNLIHLLYGEKPAKSPPITVENLIQDQIKFYKYVYSTLDNLNRSARDHLKSLLPIEKQGKLSSNLKTMSLMARLGWSNRTFKYEQAFKRAANKDTPEGKILCSTLNYYRNNYKVPER